MKLYRDLDEQETATFRAWARTNYQPHSEIKGIWHPVVQDECVRINREATVDLADLQTAGRS